MGDIIASLFSGFTQAHYDKAAANQAMTGFNWLSGNPQFQSYLTQGSAANDMIASLLGVGGNPAAGKTAFNNYLNSSGYQFQLDQGSKAISGNAATRGLLNSGATAKAETQYGQNLGSQYFGNFLNQLTGLAGRGESAGIATGEAGTIGGGNAAGYTQGIGQAIGQGVSGAMGGASNYLGLFMG